MNTGRREHGLEYISRMLQRKGSFKECRIPQHGTGMEQIARVLGRNACVVGVQPHLAFKAISVRQRLNARSGQAVFRIADESGLHDLSLLPLKRLFVASFHGYPHFIALTDCLFNIL